ncbi:hypothetical protein EDB92DRAFT_1829591 [Lactarius akahatsu]|uniref:HNH nuclease domain-containing protein n=1 Tax=Lactarius akahatsu TaxID=416441 RepID=A0AAD4LPB8_9AGAM|nr:hypothetical protein EDB92DRAFT_1829591 [Lactarius akahatsu]
MSQLPDSLPTRLGHSEKIEEIRKAYSTLLNIQEAISASDTTKASRESHEQKLVHVRVVGYLIREGPSLTASEFVAKEVNLCEEDEDKIDKAGERYFHHYLCAFKKSGGRTPASSLSAFDAFESKKEMAMEMLRQAEKPPQDHKAAKRQALVRDDFQCVVSGKYDLEMTRKNDDLRAAACNFSPPRVGITQCAHIIPSSTNKSILDSKDKHEHAASFWAILGCFGYEDIQDKLKGKDINSLDNVMTLGMEIHHCFDQLMMWFEAVEGSPDTYTIKATEPLVLALCKAADCKITLTSADERLPLPNPDYLEIHAACCRVAHLSGAGEYMDKVLEDLEDTRVLSEDGSTAHMLSFALQKEAIAVV